MSASTESSSSGPGLFRRSLGRLQDSIIRTFAGVDGGTEKDNFYDCVDKNMNGETVPMSKYKGNVLLVVNVASKWGLTKKNYTEFPKLADKYGPQGFKVWTKWCGLWSTSRERCLFHEN